MAEQSSKNVAAKEKIKDGQKVQGKRFGHDIAEPVVKYLVLFGAWF